MKKAIFLSLTLIFSINAKAWWDPGHLVTAMIAYKMMNEQARKNMDKYVKTMQRDYEHVNHFIALSVWPDDIKGEDVRVYDPMHYTNIPYNPDGVALPPKPEVNVIWAIGQAKSILYSPKARAIEKTRQLAFLCHYVGDLHQPLHAATMFKNERPGGGRGGNSFRLDGKWRNLHMLWDDGCGYLSDYNDINPYGKPKEALTEEEINRLNNLADSIISAHPKESIVGLELLDADFWALESHKLAIKYGYQGKVAPEGRRNYIKENTEPSEYYIQNGQAVVQKRLATGGYRLAMILNEIFSEERND